MVEAAGEGRGKDVFEKSATHVATARRHGKSGDAQCERRGA